VIEMELDDIISEIKTAVAIAMMFAGILLLPFAVNNIFLLFIAIILIFLGFAVMAPI